MYDYSEFLAKKHIRPKSMGFDVADFAMNRSLKPWQMMIVKWAARRGRAAIFANCGLGKTLMQLEWARLVHEYAGKSPVLIVCPLAVAEQTAKEASKFRIGCSVNVVRSQSGVMDGVNITNYERLHLFEPNRFSGIVLDESSILKSFMGSTKQKLVSMFRETPFRLCCTATPAPNDRVELGNHSEFLGVMPANEMLARWFVNDGFHAGKYRLRRHGECDFWRWVATWAVGVSSPSDLGFDDSEYKLPPLRIHEHVVESLVPDGFLFAATESVSATEVHREKRTNLEARVAKIREILNAEDGFSDQWVIWCDTDYEQDAIEGALKGESFVSIRGKDAENAKVEREAAWRRGDERVMLSKPEIFGYGINWQHCHRLTWFAGYSFEKWYQAVRRLWRFGQTHPVDAHIVMTEREACMMEAITRKSNEHEQMQSEIAALMGPHMRSELGVEDVSLDSYRPSKRLEVPSWVKSRC